MEQKKLYITPDVEIMLLYTADVMKVSEPSDTPVPPGTSSSAPERRTEVF